MWHELNCKSLVCKRFPLVGDREHRHWSDFLFRKHRSSCQATEKHAAPYLRPPVRHLTWNSTWWISVYCQNTMTQWLTGPNTILLLHRLKRIEKLVKVLLFEELVSIDDGNMSHKHPCNTATVKGRNVDVLMNMVDRYKICVKGKQTKSHFPV